MLVLALSAGGVTAIPGATDDDAIVEEPIEQRVDDPSGPSEVLSPHAEADAEPDEDGDHHPSHTPKVKTPEGVESEFEMDVKHTAKRLKKELDHDSDGKITHAELAKHQKTLFIRHWLGEGMEDAYKGLQIAHDVHEDTEVFKEMASISGSVDSITLSELLKEYADAKSEAALSGEPVMDGIEDIIFGQTERFNTADHNKDGELSFVEYRWYVHRDTEGEGIVDNDDDHASAASEIMEHADKNRDGHISDAELNADPQGIGELAFPFGLRIEL